MGNAFTCLTCLLWHHSPCPSLGQSAAERAREKKLRDDPMAIVVGPMHVDCKRCGNRIKLSSKSLYDTFHWRTHRSRCLKKRNGAKKVRGTKDTVSGIPSDQYLLVNSLKLSSPMRGGVTSPPGEPRKQRELTPKLLNKGHHTEPYINGDSHSANLDLLTSVANAALRRTDGNNDSSPSPKEFSKLPPEQQWRWSPSSDPGCHGSLGELDELRMREAIESLALLSRSG